MSSKYVFKGILAGDGGVGKTSIAVRYMENRFDENMKMTIGVGHMTKKMSIDGTDVNITLWDLAGQPHFREVVNTYFRGASFAIVVYDITRRMTLENTTDWVDRIKIASPNCKFIFVGNKVDERDNKGSLSHQDGIEFASKYNADCVEVSAKTGTAVDEVFTSIVRKLIS
mgnify:CR=1 FL=1